MSKAMQLIGVILLGIFTLVIINLMSDVRSTSELDYYLLQEVTEASMYDAVDYSYYRDTGLLKVDRDMFLENFTRRFAQSVDNNREYNIEIIDFNETPPKVSIRATANSVASIKGEAASIETEVNGILETIYDDLVMSRGLYKVYSTDATAPSIETKWNGSQYEIVMKDETALEEYCIVYLPKNQTKFSKSNATGTQCFRNVDGLKEATVTRSLFASNDTNEWIVVYDRGRNWRSEPLAAIAPYIYEYSYNASKGSLYINMRDSNDEVVAYKILVDSNDPNNGQWISVNSTEIANGYQATINIDEFYSRIAQEGEHDYYIFAKDESGLVSAGQRIKQLSKIIGQRPTIEQMDFDDSFSDLILKFQDVDGDLSKYIVTTDNSDSEPTKGWKSISDDYGSEITISEKITKSGNYHIWVKDKAGNYAKGYKKISIFSITYSGLESLKKPQTLNINVNSDDFGWMEISIKLPNGTVKNETIYDKSYSIQLNKHGSWTISTKVYNKNGNLLTVGNRFPDNQFVKSYDMDLNYAALYHYVCSKGSPKPNDDSMCVGTDTKTEPYTYSCESGYTQDGNSCYKTEDANCTKKVCREGATDFQGTCIKKYSSQPQEQCHKNGPNFYFDGDKKECWVKEKKICSKYSCKSGGVLDGDKCTYTQNATPDSTPPKPGYTDNGKEWVKNTPFEINANYVPYCPPNSGTLNNNITPPMCEF